VLTDTTLTSTRAEALTGYRIRGLHHLAVVAWVEAPDRTDTLHSGTAGVLADVTGWAPLAVPVDETTLWAWVSAPTPHRTWIFLGWRPSCGAAARRCAWQLVMSEHVSVAVGVGALAAAADGRAVPVWAVTYGWSTNSNCLVSGAAPPGSRDDRYLGCPANRSLVILTDPLAPR
jgi:hypothetical protein